MLSAISLSTSRNKERRDTSAFFSTISYNLEKTLRTFISLQLQIFFLSSVFSSIGETIAT